MGHTPHAAHQAPCLLLSPPRHRRGRLSSPGVVRVRVAVAGRRRGLSLNAAVRVRQQHVGERERQARRRPVPAPVRLGGPRLSRECPGRADAAGAAGTSRPLGKLGHGAGRCRLPTNCYRPAVTRARCRPLTTAAAAACGAWGCCSARVSAAAVIVATVQPDPLLSNCSCISSTVAYHTTATQSISVLISPVSDSRPPLAVVARQRSLRSMIGRRTCQRSPAQT